MDADAAFSCLKEFEETACVIVKHANPVVYPKARTCLRFINKRSTQTAYQLLAG